MASPVSPPVLPAQTVSSTQPAEAVVDAGGASLRVSFDDQPYPVTLYAGDTSLGRIDSPDTILVVEAGSVRLRVVNESLFLNADLGALTLKRGERRSVSLPRLASVVLAVRGEDYSGVRILIDGRQVPGPYPAQVARIAPGPHKVVYRWISGPASGREVEDTIALLAGGHFVVRAGLDNDRLVVQQLR